jgi:hypothetical protein
MIKTPINPARRTLTSGIQAIYGVNPAQTGGAAVPTPVVTAIYPGVTLHAPKNPVVTAAFSIPMTSATLGLTQSGSPVSGTSSYNSTTNAVSFTLSSPLTTGLAYVATVNGTATDGSSLSTYTWQFTVNHRRPKWFPGLSHYAGRR